MDPGQAVYPFEILDDVTVVGGVAGSRGCGRKRISSSSVMSVGQARIVLSGMGSMVDR